MKLNDTDSYLYQQVTQSSWANSVYLAGLAASTLMWNRPVWRISP